jgi:hypothetical protein
MPANAGIQPVAALDSGVRRNDDVRLIPRMPNDDPRQPSYGIGRAARLRQNWKPVEKCRRAALPSEADVSSA